jgi:hypothetical protein
MLPPCMASPYESSRVRGQTLIAQGYKPLPAEPDWHLLAHPALQESLRLLS